MLKLTDDYFVDADTYNWILVKKRISDKGKNKGEVVYDSWKFFPTLESLMRYVKNAKDKSLISRYNDFDEYLAKISTEDKKWLQSCSRLCEGIKKESVK